VVPTERDIYPTKSYAKNALVQPGSRALFRQILDQGWIDAIRKMHPDQPMYTLLLSDVRVPSNAATAKVLLIPERDLLKR